METFQCLCVQLAGHGLKLALLDASAKSKGPYVRVAYLENENRDSRSGRAGGSRDRSPQWRKLCESDGYLVMKRRYFAKSRPGAASRPNGETEPGTAGNQRWGM